MTDIIFEQAVRAAVPQLMSLAGRSGSGKTYGALLMARGLVGPEGKICVIDTENRRSTVYADDPAIGGFDVFHLFPPFSSERYAAAIDAAEAQKADVIVIDSLSHEWTGIGGCIDQADDWQAKHPRSPGPLAWNKPKRGHKRLVAQMLMRSHAHIIACLRAERKLIAYKDEQGKQQFAESEDVVPQQEKHFIYEVLVSGTVSDEDHTTKWTKVPEPLRGALHDGQLIGIETGQAIAEWANGGASLPDQIEAALNETRAVARQGKQALSDHWPTLSKPIRAALRSYRDEFAMLASQAEEDDEPFPPPENGIDHEEASL